MGWIAAQLLVAIVLTIVWWPPVNFHDDDKPTRVEVTIVEN